MIDHTTNVPEKSNSWLIQVGPMLQTWKDVSGKLSHFESGKDNMIFENLHPNFCLPCWQTTLICYHQIQVQSTACSDTWFPSWLMRRTVPTMNVEHRATIKNYSSFKYGEVRCFDQNFLQRYLDTLDMQRTGRAWTNAVRWAYLIGGCNGIGSSVKPLCNITIFEELL